jgi:arabinose-5-phosphate isomerase
LISPDKIQELALQTIKIEQDCIANLSQFIDNKFVETVFFIKNSTGRVIISGIGKSAIIAQKIVATFNSTGTPAIFMHAADATHGDIGTILTNDIVIIISNSGETPEIVMLAGLVKANKNQLIAMTGNKNSSLAKKSDYLINTFVEKEACPNNIVPTSSTTAQLVMGDVLAVCLMKLNNVNKNDFAKFHPGGALGKKLFITIGDLVSKNQKPQVDIHATIKEVIIEISSKRLGATCVVENNQLVGIITDGDIRRLLEKTNDFVGITAKDIMSVNPKTISPEKLAVEAIPLIEQHQISQIIVLENNAYVGMIHIHDIVKEGLL